MQVRSLGDLKSFAVAAAAAALALSALPASAALVTPVAVSLIANGGYTQGGATVPTPISATSNISYGNPITAITPGIGTYLLSGETVELIGESVHIRSYAGDNLAPGPNNLRTGLLGSGGSDKARWEINGLDIAGRDITGFSVSTLDTSGTGAGVFSGLVAGTLFVAMTDTDLDGSYDRLSVDLEDLRFIARPGVASYNLNFADITISFTSVATGGPTTPTVPEPSSIALCLAALAGCGASARARRKAAAAAASGGDAR